MTVLTVSDVSMFFKKAIDEADHDLGTGLTEATKAYLLGLLSDPTHTEKLDFETIAFATWFERADAATKTEALEIYRNIGDTTLYRAGMLNAYDTHKCLSPEYFSDIGCIAYQRLAGLLQKRSAVQATVFDELSGRFEDLISLLRSVVGAHSKSDKERLRDEIERLMRPDSFLIISPQGKLVH